MAEFAHLHVHSDFSLQDAAATVMALADRAEETGMKYLALTDHGNMFGAMEFLAACRETINEKGQHEERKTPVKPIIGCEVYVSPGSRFEKKGSENENRYYHLILLASSRTGYFNLVKLCSFAYTEGFYYRPRIDEELLVKYHSGLIALSACVSGEIPRLIQAGKLKEAEEKARHYGSLFGNDEQGNPNFYLEIQDHGISAATLRGSLSQREISEAVIGISKRTGIPLVLTNDVHYLSREDAVAHDILLCIGTGKLRTEEKRKKYHGDQFYFKSEEEMAAIFPEYPEAMVNTIRIAERCHTDIPKIETRDLPKFLPDFEIPKTYDNADAYLRHLALEGLEKRYLSIRETGGKPWEEIQKRAEYELATIIQMGFTGYFLIVADFINWAKARDIPVGPGRGSGAGSIVAYSLRITDIDPLKYHLLFERFLNPDRISMPDFDVDFANEGREEVINYVTGKYGQERVGQIITFGTLGAKAVIKDVARVLNISIPESEMITKLIPRDPKITLKKAIDTEPKLRDLEQDPKYTELFALAKKLEGLNRHSSIHAAGVVIGKSSLDDFVPLYQDPKTGFIATQYTMNYLEDCGLVKMDFLGLKTLDVIKHTVKLIRQRGGEFRDFNIETINETDEKTYKMLGEGKSFEVFQFESDGMQNILKQVKPGSIEDLTALNSLYRPGPMDNIPRFIDSKTGRQEISYPDPSLEGALRETYGVIVYQEQVMEVARIIAGYSMGQADLLRRAMGKKKKEILDKEKIPFLAGAAKQGYSKKLAGEIYDMLVPFAGYGFNKSHAAAYSVVAYQTAFLKANFPAEFMAANLSNEIHSADKDKLSVCIGEARKMGLAIDPPDINNSSKLFSVVKDRIVYGLLGIKGLGENSADEIVDRRKEGPYRNFMDFLNRVDIKVVGKSVIERLIQTGAFDQFGTSREKLQGNLEKAAEHAQNIKEDKKYGQTSLFGEALEKEYVDFVFEEFPETSRAEKLKIEKELIGFYFSGHPMDQYRELWEKAVKNDLGRPETLIPGSCILIGLIKSIRTHIGKSGKMAFAVLEDYNGEIDVTFFSQAWERCEDKIEADRIAIIQGRIEYQKDKDRFGFLAETCISAAEAEAAMENENALVRQMEEYREIWEETVKLDLSRAEGADPRTVYTLIGILKSLEPFHTKSGNDMAYAILADYRGEIGVTIFPKPWNELKDKLRENTIIGLKGKIKNDSFKNKPAFYADSMVNINKLKKAGKKNSPQNTVIAETGIRELHIQLRKTAADNEDNLKDLYRIIEKNPGSVLIYIHIPMQGEEITIRTQNRINPGTAKSELADCAAIAKIWEK